MNIERCDKLAEADDATGRLAYIVAEFCPGPFYSGWGLFERDHNDGRMNNDGRSRSRMAEIWEAEVEEMLRFKGYEPPPARQHSRALAEWVAATFPHGLRVRVTFGTPIYELAEIVDKRPRQRRGVVRTIRGAAMAMQRPP